MPLVVWHRTDALGLRDGSHPHPRIAQHVAARELGRENLRGVCARVCMHVSVCSGGGHVCVSVQLTCCELVQVCTRVCACVCLYLHGYLIIISRQPLHALTSTLLTRCWMHISSVSPMRQDEVVQSM